jgi:hypothetical protein
MTIQTINLGSYANDGTGDDLRTAFEKVNANFDVLRFEVTNGTNLGTGTHIFAQKNATDPYLEFKTLTSMDASVTITSSATMVDLHAVTRVEEDTAPMLGGDLGLNGYTIKAIDGGGVESKIWNIDIPLLNSLVALIFESNNLSINMGYFLTPTGYDLNEGGYILDMGVFLDPNNNNINFGLFVPEVD